MHDEDRGKINNRRRASQIIDFSGLRFGKITPTDIDGVIDFGNSLFVYLEYKYGDAQMPYGQRLALERMAEADEKAGIPACVLQCSHNDEGDIDGANSRVSTFWYGGEWRTPREELTVRQAIERIIEQRLPGTTYASD